MKCSSYYNENYIIMVWNINCNENYAIASIVIDIMYEHNVIEIMLQCNIA